LLSYHFHYAFLPPHCSSFLSSKYLSTDFNPFGRLYYCISALLQGSFFFTRFLILLSRSCKYSRLTN
jgi:hypothetical protein